MTYFAHEAVTIANRGLRDERVYWPGDEEVFSTREAAQASADRLNASHKLALTVYEFTDDYPPACRENYIPR